MFFSLHAMVSCSIFHSLMYLYHQRAAMAAADGLVDLEPIV